MPVNEEGQTVVPGTGAASSADLEVISAMSRQSGYSAETPAPGDKPPGAGPPHVSVGREAPVERPPHDVGAEALIERHGSRDGNPAVRHAGRGRGFISQVDEQIFDTDRQVVVDRVVNAPARRPADPGGLRIGREKEPVSAGDANKPRDIDLA